MINFKKFLWGFYALSFIAAFYLVIVFSMWFGYENKFFPGTYIAGISVSGLSEDEATTKIKEITDDFIKRDPLITFGSKKVKASDLGISFEVEETIAKVKKEKISPFGLGKKQEHLIIIDYSHKKFLKLAQEIELGSRTPVSNPRVSGESLEVVAGQIGRRLIYGELSYSLKESLGRLETEVRVKPIKISPTYDTRALTDIVPQIEGRLKNGLTLMAIDREISVTIKEMVNWIALERSSLRMAENFYLPSPGSLNYQGSYFSKTEIENYLKEISTKIDAEPVNAILGTREGKVIIKEKEKTGRSVDIGGSAEGILKALESSEKIVALKIEIIQAEIRTETLPDLGLKELIAVGYSNFSGSPQNRRHNIRVGAEKFNGMLLAPNEVFSFTANMGEIDAANGYLPELVIINNETRPEYGGGLCQVSTTAFRAALNAGFPILERKAHSYPVQYYQPYGTDATIYDPNPDLKFKNDSGYYLLIQTRIVGNYLYFDFYGTRRDVDIKFSGNKSGNGAVALAERVNPYIYGQGGRGPGSFKAVIYRFIYDGSGKLLKTDYFLSNYDSPDKYPR